MSNLFVDHNYCAAFLAFFFFSGTDYSSWEWAGGRCQAILGIGRQEEGAAETGREKKLNLQSKKKKKKKKKATNAPCTNARTAGSDIKALWVCRPVGLITCSCISMAIRCSCTGINAFSGR